MRRSNIKFAVLMLPVIGLFLLWHAGAGMNASQVPVPRRAPTVFSGKSMGTRLKIFVRGLKGAKMSFTVGHFEADGNLSLSATGPVPAVASFSPAPLLYDGNTATGYPYTSPTGGSPSCYALLTFSTPTKISKVIANWQAVFASQEYIGVFGSNDGTTYTLLGQTSAGVGASSGVMTQAVSTATAYTYFRILFDPIDNTQAAGLTELQVFDQGGTLIAPGLPPTASLSAAPPGILVPSSSTLSWTTANSTTQSIDNGVGSVGASGSVSVSPLVTTTYTLTATGPGGTATSSATITVTPRRESHVFSSGILIAAGNIPFALLQDITLTFRAGKAALLYDCLWSKQFPVDVGFAESEALLQAQTCSISPSAIVTLIGGSLNTGSVPNILTLAKTISKLPFTLVATTEDTAGKQQVYTFGKVFCPDLTLPTKASDFAKYDFNMFALPDGSGNIATAALPW